MSYNFENVMLQSILIIANEGESENVSLEKIKNLLSQLQNIDFKQTLTIIIDGIDSVSWHNKIYWLT